MIGRTRIAVMPPQVILRRVLSRIPARAIHASEGFAYAQGGSVPVRRSRRRQGGPLKGQTEQENPKGAEHGSTSIKDFLID